jgi:hypothetical protein
MRRTKYILIVLFAGIMVLLASIKTYGVYRNMQVFNILKMCQVNVVGAYYGRHSVYPTFDGEGESWRQALRAEQPAESLVDHASFVYNHLLVFGINGPWAPWGLSRKEWGRRIEKLPSLSKSDDATRITFPLIVAVPASGAADLDVENDIWADDPFRLIRAAPGVGRIRCYVLGADLSVYTAYIDATAGRELVRDGRRSSIWPAAE